MRHGRTRILVCSDRRSAGVADDTVGPLLAQELQNSGWENDSVEVVTDDQDVIEQALRVAIDDGVDLIVTTGGTGFAPRDVTPEATRSVIDRESPGLAEAMRLAGRASTPMTWLSRGVAGIAGTTVIVNVPGSSKGAVESLAAIAEVLPHAVAQARGKGAHD